jgi:curved DNA-binding protein
MQNFRNYYQILGVPRDATVEEIKKAYRRLARQLHPDVNPGDKAAEDRFKDINEAYDVLSDIDKRTQYDQFTKFWKQKGFQGKQGVKIPNFGSWGNSKASKKTADNVDFSDYSDFNKFFDQVLGRRREVRMATPNDAPMDVPEPWSTGSRKTSYVANSREGRKENVDREMRREAREFEDREMRREVKEREIDDWENREVKKDIEARLTLRLERAYTGGIERIRLDDGQLIEVEMPPAMVSGQRIRLRDRGIGGGDLYLKITVSPHPFFKLEGADICCELPLTPCEAVLGGDVEVPTLDGLVKMKLPPGVPSGKRLRLANKGYPTGKGDRGDQLVEIRVEIPKEISDEERELYEKLRQIATFKPRQNLLD